MQAGDGGRVRGRRVGMACAAPARCARLRRSGHPNANYRKEVTPAELHAIGTILANADPATRKEWDNALRYYTDELERYRQQLPVELRRPLDYLVARDQAKTLRGIVERLRLGVTVNPTC